VNVPRRIIASLLVWLVAAPVMALERPESKDVAQNYLLFCGGCHGDAGAGVPHKVPVLNGSIGRYLKVEGGREFLLRVPGVANSQLSDAALTDVMNLCIDKFADGGRGTDFKRYTVPEVTAARRHPLLSVSRMRRELLLKAGVSEAELTGNY
jgi:hypothetical protein